MKNFAALTPLEANKIQNEKINSLFRISNNELDPFVKIETLNGWFVEVPPININTNEDLKLLLSGVDTKTLIGKLQWMYLKTYLNGGVPLFRRANDNDCEILFDFVINWQHIELTLGNPEHIFHGCERLRAIWLLQLYSIKNLLMEPSISIKITIDGQEYGPQSISTLISTIQPNQNVAVINRLFSDFNEMKVSIIFNDPKTNDTIRLLYK